MLLSIYIWTQVHIILLFIQNNMVNSRRFYIVLYILFFENQTRETPTTSLIVKNLNNCVHLTYIPAFH